MDCGPGVNPVIEDQRAPGCLDVRYPAVGRASILKPVTPETFHPPTLDRFRGCLLGLAVGDALGAPFEGLDAGILYASFGPTQNVVSNPPVEGTLFYTDDTQMAIGVAEALAERGRVEEESLAAAFAANFEADRGYGAGAAQILQTMAAGGDWRYLAETQFPGGSYGNGAAMRVAPVGLLFHDDLGRVAEEARRSALPTHLHPLAIDGARLVALAVALALRGGPFDRAAFFGELEGRAETEEFREQLYLAAALSPDDPVSRFGSSLPAHRSVTTAIACFAADPDDYTAVIAHAIGLGGDTDTLAAMAGAVSGARLGIAAVPPHLLDRLEDGPKGRGYIDRLATRLFERWAELARV